jgi:competence protein ComEA
MFKLVKLLTLSTSLLFAGATMAEVEKNTTVNDQIEAAVPADQGTTAMITANEQQPTTALININTADVETLKTVKGVDSKIAKAIVDYRTQNGNFKSVDDLAKIKEISKTMFNRISKNLTL